MSERFWEHLRRLVATSDPVGIGMSREDCELVKAIATNPSLGTCATCKWAEDARVMNHPELLACTRDNYEGSTMFTGSGDDPWVEPHHGCVQWEGK